MIHIPFSMGSGQCTHLCSQTRHFPFRRCCDVVPAQLMDQNGVHCGHSAITKQASAELLNSLASGYSSISTSSFISLEGMANTLVIAPFSIDAHQAPVLRLRVLSPPGLDTYPENKFCGSHEPKPEALTALFLPAPCTQHHFLSLLRVNRSIPSRDLVRS